MIKRRSLITVIAPLALFTLSCSTETQSADGEFPVREIDLIAGGGPGGGLDTATRQLVQAMEGAGVKQNLNVINNAAGNGNAARAEVLSRPNDGYAVALDSNRVILNPLLGAKELELEEFTPLAQLTIDEIAWVVPKASEFETAQQVIDRMKEDVSSIIFGVGSLPSNDQLNILRPLLAAGVDEASSANIVNFDDGNAVNTELLGGRIHVASTGFSEARELAESGDFRILATSGEQPRLEGVPTWHELGYDVTIEHWRGVFGKANMPDEARQWWEKVIKKATESEEWKQSVNNVGIFPDYLPSEEFKQELEEQRDQMVDVYTRIGMLENDE